ncbi:MAG: amidophosphoribosyltransferase [Methanobacteriota archaeon]|nr:MAG: amidophosphoribosyltransferase [Euryarchaeota archaeon]
MKEECGVVGIYSLDNRDVAPLIFYALYSLQHRGQESCGITVVNEKFATQKEMGLVSEVFDFEKLTALKGSFGVGHVRYSTCGESRIENAAPFVVSHSLGYLSIGHNGNIANSAELRKGLEEQGEVFISTTDTEVIAHLIVRGLIRTGDIVDSIKEAMKKLNGSYSLAIATDDSVIAVRDPLGIKPLCLGRLGDTYIVASESVALDSIGAEYLRDVEPGEILVINESGLQSHRGASRGRTAHCMFEYVYFSRPDSILDSRLVYTVRERIGEIMAEDDHVDVDFVMAVPDSAIPFALGYARARGLPYREGLIKNRYVGRTFILPKQKARELAVRVKLNPLITNVKGKRVVLFDDSIVRGTTSARIIQILKDAGAAEVHMRIGSPPIISPCYLGIDMPTKEELIASSGDVEEVRRKIGADSLKYLSIEGLLRAIGKDERQLCLGCLTGDYPVPLEQHEQVKLVEYIK